MKMSELFAVSSECKCGKTGIKLCARIADRIDCDRLRLYLSRVTSSIKVLVVRFAVKKVYVSVKLIYYKS